MNVFEATEPEQVAIFRDIRLQWRRRLSEGKFYAEGEQVILRLLQSSVRVMSLLITREYLERWKGSILSKKDPELNVWVAEKKWMEENTAQKLNQACLAIGRVPLSPPLETVASFENVCFVALDGINHAVNVGAILRNCAAFGVTAVLTDKTSSSPYSWRSIRTSLGGVFYVPVFSDTLLIEQLRKLSNHSIELISVDPQGLQTVSAFDFKKNCCYIFGSEHRGISQEILDLVSARVAIPHSEKVDSLNVAAASAIILQRSREARFSSRLQSRKDP